MSERIALHVAASPNGAASTSRSVAQALMERLAAPGGPCQSDLIDVWETELPPFDATMIAAKFAVLKGHAASEEQAAMWRRATALSERFNRADLLVLSVPMWNHGVPYRLKHFIDVVTLPGQNWSWSREAGYRPLLRGKGAVLVLSSAGTFPQPDHAGLPNEDFVRPYLRQWLRFIGVRVIDEIVIAPTLGPPEHLSVLKTKALERAEQVSRALVG